jgi:hypothetical protein
MRLMFGAFGGLDSRELAEKPDRLAYAAAINLMIEKDDEATLNADNFIVDKLSPQDSVRLAKVFDKMTFSNRLAVISYLRKPFRTYTPLNNNGVNACAYMFELDLGDNRIMAILEPVMDQITKILIDPKAILKSKAFFDKTAIGLLLSKEK